MNKKNFVFIILSLISINIFANFWDSILGNKINDDKNPRIEVIIKTDIDKAIIYFDEHKNSFYAYDKQRKLTLDMYSDYAMTITGEYEKDYQTYKCEKKLTHAFKEKDEVLAVKLKDNCKLIPKKELDKSKINISSYTRNKGSYIYLSFRSPIINDDVTEYLNIYEVGNEDREIKYYSKYPKSSYSYIYADFKPQTKYKVVLKKGLETKKSLNRSDKVLYTKFNDLTEELKFSKGSRENYIIGSDEALDVEVVNTDELNVGIYQIPDENINYAELFTGSYYYDKLKLANEAANYNLKTNAKKNTKTKVQVNLKQHLKNKTGIFVVIIKNKDRSYRRIYKTLIKSNIGTIAKLSVNQIFLSANSLVDNSAITSAKVELYSNKNKLILSGATNDNGVFISNYENLAQENPKLLVVKKDDDISTLDISTYNNNKKYSAFIDLARNLVRPSESLTINTVIRDKNLLSSNLSQAQIIIRNPARKIILEENISLNKDGVGQYIFDTTNDMKTGGYDINLKVGDKVVAYKSFLVETFIPQKIKVDFSSDKEEYNFDEEVKLNLSAKYLFGGSSAGLGANIDGNLSGRSYYSKNFKDYIFSNNLVIDKPNLRENNITLNKNGKWDKSYNIADLIKESSINKAKLYVYLNSSVSDDGRKIRKSTYFDIKPFKEITGIKRPNGCFIAGGDAKFSLKTINSKTDKVISKNYKVGVKINKKTYHYYAGNQIKEVLTAKALNNGEFIFKDGEIGEYEIIVTNPNGQVAQTNFCISGSGDTPFNVNEKKSYKVEIIPNKKVVKAGDKINLSIKSPIAGKLILTFEEDGIKHHQIFKMNGNNFNTDVMVPKGINNGFYIDATVIRDISTDNNVLPYKVVGNTYIKLNRDKNKADIKINSLDTTKSNSTLTVNIETNSPNGSAIISIVDNGILNITNFSTPDYFKQLTQRVYNLINNFTIYDNLLSPTKLLINTVGGGAEADMLKSKLERKKLGKNLSKNDINKRVKSFVWSSQILKLDNSGKLSAKIKIPDYNGSAKLKVLVIGKDKIGNTDKDIIIKDDIIIKPTLPRFLIKGDEFEIPVRIFNNTNEIKIINLNSLTSNHLQILSDFENITLHANQNKLINIKVRAVKTGLANIKLSFGEFYSETNILVKSNYDYQQISFNGIIKNNETKKFDLTKLASDEKSAAYLNLSTSPYTSLGKDAKYLISYPHGCAEQTSSKLLALLYAKTILNDNKENQKLLSKRKGFIEDGIIKLSNMQNTAGNFTYWQGSSDVNHYASLFALNTLKKLDNQGFKVPSDILVQGSKTLGNGYNSKYPFMVLEINRDIKLANYLYDNNLYKNSISKSLLLASVMSENANDIASKKLITYAKKIFNNETYKQKRTYDGNFYSNIKELAKSLSIYAKYFNKNDNFALDLLSIITNHIAESKLYSTQDKAFVMAALYDYYGKSLATQNIDNIINFNGKKTTNRTEYFAGFSLDNNDKLSVKNKGDAIYYGLDLRVPTLNPIKGSSILNFKTSLLNKNTQEINPEDIKLGDELLIKVKVESAQNIKNLASIINIPAGFEIVNERLYNTNTKFKNKNYYPEHKEYRDDKLISYINLTKNKQTTYYIKVVATTRGEFIMPSSYIEAMYDTRINSSDKFVKKISIK